MTKNTDDGNESKWMNECMNELTGALKIPIVEEDAKNNARM